MKNKESPTNCHSIYSDLRNGTPYSQNKLNSSFSKTSHEKAEIYNSNQNTQSEPYESRFLGKHSLERIIDTCLVETNISPEIYKGTVSPNGDLPSTTPFEQTNRNTGRTSIPKRRQNQNTVQGPSCANLNCSHPKKHKRKFPKKPQMFCEECTRIIDDNEYCHICLEISSAEPREWVECERCGKWNHIECEESAKNGIKNLAAKLGLGLDAEPTKFVYHCINCRNTSSTKPNKNVIFEMPPTKILKPDGKNIFDASSLLKGREKTQFRGPFDEQFYSYFYSENYQPVEKLVSSTGRSVSVSEHDFIDDQTEIYASVCREYKENGIEDPGLLPKITYKKRSSDSDLMISAQHGKNGAANENGRGLNGITGTRKKRLNSESRILRKKSQDGGFWVF